MVDNNFVLKFTFTIKSITRVSLKAGAGKVSNRVITEGIRMANLIHFTFINIYIAHFHVNTVASTLLLLLQYLHIWHHCHWILGYKYNCSFLVYPCRWHYRDSHWHLHPNTHQCLNKYFKKTIIVKNCHGNKKNKKMKWFQC